LYTYRERTWLLGTYRYHDYALPEHTNICSTCQKRLPCVSEEQQCQLRVKPLLAYQAIISVVGRAVRWDISCVRGMNRSVNKQRRTDDYTLVCHAVCMHGHAVVRRLLSAKIRARLDFVFIRACNCCRLVSWNVLREAMLLGTANIHQIHLH
jgi:hypothetical protein